MLAIFNVLKMVLFQIQSKMVDTVDTGQELQKIMCKHYLDTTQLASCIACYLIFVLSFQFEIHQTSVAYSIKLNCTEIWLFFTLTTVLFNYANYSKAWCEIYFGLFIFSLFLYFCMKQSWFNNQFVFISIICITTEGKYKTSLCVHNLYIACGSIYNPTTA